MLKIFHKWKLLELVSPLSWALESDHRILECFPPVTPPWCTCCCGLVFLLKLAVYFDHKLNNIIIIIIFNDFNMPLPLLTIPSCNSDPQQLFPICLRDTRTRMHKHTPHSIPCTLSGPGWQRKPQFTSPVDFWTHKGPGTHVCWLDAACQGVPESSVLLMWEAE